MIIRPRYESISYNLENIASYFSKLLIKFKLLNLNLILNFTRIKEHSNRETVDQIFHHTATILIIQLKSYNFKKVRFYCEKISKNHPKFEIGSAL